MSSQYDDCNVPSGDDTYFISREDQQSAAQLVEDGTCKPWPVSLITATSIYLVVWHRGHGAPARLKLSPFEVPKFPHQTFYGATFRYARCCDEGPGQNVVTATVQQVYDAFFPLGKCRFDEHGQQEVPIDTTTGSNCRERARLGLQHLRYHPDPAHRRRAHDISHDNNDPDDYVPTVASERPPKRLRLHQSHTEPAIYSNNSRQPAATRPDNTESDTIPSLLEEDSPRQYNPGNGDPKKQKGGPERAAGDIVTKTLRGLQELQDHELIATLPVWLDDCSLGIEVLKDADGSRDSASIWKLGCDFTDQAKNTAWFLFLISTCLRVVEKTRGKNIPPLDATEERKRYRWESSVFALHGIINMLGVMGLRLYDVYCIKDFRFSKSAPRGRQKLVRLVAKDLADRKICVPPDLRVLFIPNLILRIFNSKHEEERLSQAHICKILGLDIFAEYQIHSAFAPLRQLHSERQRLENFRLSNIAETQGSSQVEDSLPLVATPTEVRLGGSCTGAATSTAVQPSKPEHYRGPNCFEEHSKRVTVQEPGRARVTPPPTPPIAPANNEPISRPSSNMDQPQGYDPQQDPTCTTASLPPAASTSDSAVTQRHVAEDPCLDRRSEPQSDVQVQDSSANPQSSRWLETGATHQPALSSPETREEPSTTANDINSGSAQESSTQDLSPIQSHGYGLSHNATEISYLQRHSPSLHPPTTQIMPDSTAIESHVIGTPSSGPRPESHQFTVQEHLDSTRSFVPTNLSPSSERGRRSREFATPCEALGSQHSLQGRQTSMPYAASPVQSQSYQPRDPEDTGCLDQPMDEASVMSYQPFEVYQDTNPSTAEVDWNNIALWNLEDVSTSHLLFQESGETL